MPDQFSDGRDHTCHADCICQSVGRRVRHKLTRNDGTVVGFEERATMWVVVEIGEPELYARPWHEWEVLAREGEG